MVLSKSWRAGSKESRTSQSLGWGTLWPPKSTQVTTVPPNTRGDSAAGPPLGVPGRAPGANGAHQTASVWVQQTVTPTRPCRVFSSFPGLGNLGCSGDESEAQRHLGVRGPMAFGLGWRPTGEWGGEVLGHLHCIVRAICFSRGPSAVGNTTQK